MSWTIIQDPSGPQISGYLLMIRMRFGHHFFVVIGEPNVPVAKILYDPIGDHFVVDVLEMHHVECLPNTGIGYLRALKERYGFGIDAMFVQDPLSLSIS